MGRKRKGSFLGNFARWLLGTNTPLPKRQAILAKATARPAKKRTTVRSKQSRNDEAVARAERGDYRLLRELLKTGEATARGRR